MAWLENFEWIEASLFQCIIPLRQTYDKKTIRTFKAVGGGRFAAVRVCFGIGEYIDTRARKVIFARRTRGFGNRHVVVVCGGVWARGFVVVSGAAAARFTVKRCAGELARQIAARIEFGAHFVSCGWRGLYIVERFDAVGHVFWRNGLGQVLGF